MSNQTTNELDLLRNLILGTEKNKITVLEKHFNDANTKIEDVSSVLPQAIKLSIHQNEQLADELAPVVEKAVKVSVKRDIRIFADALYPVIGPAIRKSMSETIMQMLQSINQAIEHSFSWKGIKWRFEAWKSGKTFAEIVLKHSLIYRVEQVFLIQKKTGLLLQHTTLNEVVQQDANLVSAMLTAIQDFVRDSFHHSLDDDTFNKTSNHQSNTTEHNLNQISMGDFSIWIEQGPDAVIAVALKGTAPKLLRQELITTLENIHQQYTTEIQEFDGDETNFNQVNEQLKHCLLSQYKSEEKKLSWMTLGAVLGVILGILMWFFLYLYKAQRWENYVNIIKTEPGIVITDITHHNGQTILHGLRDPLAKKPTEIASANKLTQPYTLGNFSFQPFNNEQIIFHLEPYQSLAKTIFLRRIKQQIQPPKDVEVYFNKNILTLSGKAGTDWISTLKKNIHFISNNYQSNLSQLISTIDLSTINTPKTVQLKINKGNVTATGVAPYDWIIKTKVTIQKIPGITHYDDSQLRIDLSSLNAPKNVRLNFNKGILNVSGHAHNNWIKKLSARALSLPGIEKINLKNLVNTDIRLLSKLKQDFETESVYYQRSKTISSNSNVNKDLQRILKKLQLLIQQAQLLSTDLRIIIQGFSDSRGNYSTRYEVSYLRAEHVRQYFIRQGINNSILSSHAMAKKNHATTHSSEQENQLNRRVSFIVHFLPVEKGK